MDASGPRIAGRRQPSKKRRKLIRGQRVTGSDDLTYTGERRGVVRDVV